MASKNRSSMEPPSKVARVSERVTASITTTSNNDGTTSTNGQNTVCFICGALTNGKIYSLASCVTNGTNKTRLVEVLGKMLGEDLMVVVSYNDYACRGCANILNGYAATMEEANSLKTIILNFIGKKYNVEDDLRILGAPQTVLYSKITPKESDRLLTSKSYLQKKATDNINPVPVASTSKATYPPTTTAATSSVVKIIPVPSTSKGAAVASSAPSQVLLVPTATPGVNKTLMLSKTTPENIVSGAKIVPVKATNVVKTYGVTINDKANLVEAQKEVKKQVVANKNILMKCRHCPFTTNKNEQIAEHLKTHQAKETPPTPSTSEPEPVVETNDDTFNKSPEKAHEKVLSFSKF